MIFHCQAQLRLRQLFILSDNVHYLKLKIGNVILHLVALILKLLQLGGFIVGCSWHLPFRREKVIMLQIWDVYYEKIKRTNDEK
ncbi:hypothetical protein PHJA_002833800 [Phtheirospermum japonicum]|uniref:Uncharacterized protein n=1 Tax=Phtheirospermum japonicum TaxID=374723 RepID=A0A830D2R6_9LAMI|nr:hypothetical protein PHJA_002833800 [Phtheirospermum japonicum]